MNSLVCPRCHSQTPALSDVKVELQNFLLLHQSSDGLLKKVCSTCLQSFEDSTHDFNLIQNRMNGKELVKLQLWNKRVELIREAGALMKANQFDEAIAKYELYMKTIEQSLGIRSELITAQAFIMAGKAEELPVYGLMLWDLIVANDGKNEDAQQKAATKMLEVIKGTSLRKTLMARSAQYMKKAKNKKFFKKLKKDFRKDRACYVASFAYESEDHPQVESWRNYRDEVLRKKWLGRAFIQLYYFFSPGLVKILRQSKLAKPVSRHFLEWLWRKLS